MEPSLRLMIKERLIAVQRQGWMWDVSEVKEGGEMENMGRFSHAAIQHLRNIHMVPGRFIWEAMSVQWAIKLGMELEVVGYLLRPDDQTGVEHSILSLEALCDDGGVIVKVLVDGQSQLMGFGIDRQGQIVRLEQYTHAQYQQYSISQELLFQSRFHQYYNIDRIEKLMRQNVIQG